MIVAQISDTHLALDTRDAERRMRDFALTIADINALDPAPDVIVLPATSSITGDRTNMRKLLPFLKRRGRRFMCYPAIRTTGLICVRLFPTAAISPPTATSSTIRSKIIRSG